MSAEAINQLFALADANQKQIGGLTKSVNGLVERLSRMPAQGTPSPGSVVGSFGVPNVRRGEDTMTSRGFSFMKMLGLLTGVVRPENASVELDIHNRLNNCYNGPDMAPGSTYDYKGGGVTGQNRFLAPLATSFLQEDVVPRQFRGEMKALVRAGTDGNDPEECNWIRRKVLQNHYGNVGNKALSWLNELTGGSLVAPPEMGELIELLRNKEALINAGARTVPLPPQGRLKYPRQTAASLAYWVGENAPITESIVGTGEVLLQAKKLAILIKTPNELIRFASPAAEALLRDDMTKSLALGLDLAGLEGAGGDHRPLGLVNQVGIADGSGVQTINSTKPNANGDNLVANDIYRMVASVEEVNAEFEGFIMRPKTMYKFYQLRADSVSQGDGSGPFLFSLIREAGEGVTAALAGYPVTKSTQVSQVQSKGTASNLTYIAGGMWSDMLIGMFGAIEFAATTMGDSAFTNDQSWLRGIMTADIALRHPAAFCLLNNLDVTL